MVSFSRTTRRLKRGQTLTLTELDAFLDVRVEEFDRTVTKLAKQFRAKSISLEVPRGEDLIALQPIGSAVSWTRLYEAQVRRLAQMDRAEEFLMARRYQLVKARAVLVLEEMGYETEEIPVLLRGGQGQLPSAPRSRSASEERSLVQVLDEFEALRNRYVEGALYMVLACAARYRSLGVDYADLIQEGNASLFQAIEGFDWKRDVRFKTYAQYWIHQAVLKVIYNASRTVRVPIWVQKTLAKINRVRDRERQEDGAPPSASQVGDALGMTEQRVRDLLGTKRRAISLDAEVVGEDGASLAQLLPDRRAAGADGIEDGDLGLCLDEVMEDLPSREHMIITRRFGLHGGDPETLGDIAGDLGITAERVRQLQNAALARLKKPMKMDRLKAYT